MDTYEATNLLLTKIRSIDPENASRIMGYILIQGLSDRDLLRLAFGPEPLLQNVVLKAKIGLGLPANTLSTLSAPSSPSPLNPISRPNNNNNSNPFSQTSPRITKNGPFVDFATSPPPQPWPVPGLANNNDNNSSVSPKASPFLSYDNIRAGSVLVPPFSKNGSTGSGGCSGNTGDFLDEYQLDEYLSFLDDSTSKGEEFVDPRVHLGGYSVTNGDTHVHRRRFSESDASFGAEDGGFGVGYRPCMYFARGFCKNGDNCNFVHGDFSGDNMVDVNGPSVIVGSPREMEDLYLQQQEELMRMKVAQQQQKWAQSKYMNFVLQQQNDHQRLGAVAAMMGDEFHKFGRFHPERNDFLAMGMAERANSASRQIYLTFPADSSFKDEDVSNYFSTFGPVQDVRIPYQVKRMFGFVTFVHPQTVKDILARGNPHFICDSRVLVKPYKEKGKVANNRTQQLLERGNFSPSLSPSGPDPREMYDLNLGTRMLYSTQEMMLRRKLEEQAELQQAIELQGRRLINLQLPDLRGDYIQRHQRSLSVGAPISPPRHTSINQNVILTSDSKNQEVLEDNGDNSAAATASTIVVADEQNLEHEVNAGCIQSNGTVNSMDKRFNECHGRKVENVLPDNLFASPTKSSVNQHPEFSPDLAEVKESTDFCVTSSSSENNASVPTFSTSDVASH